MTRSASAPLWAWTIAEAAATFKAGALTPVDLIEAHLARIEEVEPHLHAFIRLEAGAARTAAREAAEEMRRGLWRGPLHGIPYAVKDNYDVAGMPATAGSRLRLGHVPDRDADLVLRLRDAGAILLGKLSTWEYGTGNGGEYFDLPFPPARNPWDTARFPGGSSTGAGAAVAAGLVKFALGSDTTGSVRLPAAATGCVGVIATAGRLSLGGILPNCHSLDTPGPLAWTAADAATILSVLTGDPAITGLGKDLAGLRVGVVPNLGPGMPGPDAAIGTAFDAALQILERGGATLVDARLPVPAAECFAVSRFIGPPESAAIHEAELRDRPDAMGFALRDKLMAGLLVRAVDYIAALRRRAEIAAAIEALMQTVDVLVTYGALHVAPLLGVEPGMTAFTVDTAMTPFSLSGHPALVQCIGFTETGLPLHWQMVGQYAGEAALLAAAAAYEAATDWRTRRPEPAPAPAPPAVAPLERPSSLESARRFAKRHGLDRLSDDHLARLALLEDAVAAAGLAIPRPAHKGRPSKQKGTHNE